MESKRASYISHLYVIDKVCFKINRGLFWSPNTYNIINYNLWFSSGSTCVDGERYSATKLCCGILSVKNRFAVSTKESGGGRGSTYCCFEKWWHVLLQCKVSNASSPSYELKALTNLINYGSQGQEVLPCILVGSRV